MITNKEREYVRERLHSPGMQCRQCEITRRLLDEAAGRAVPRCPLCRTTGTDDHVPGSDECVMLIEERAWKNRT